MKIIGSMFVFIAFAWGGAAIGMNMKKRCDFLNDFIIALQVLETEISFLGAELAGAFERASQVSGVNVFSEAAKSIEKDGIDKAWSDALDKVGINSNERKILLLLSSKLGKTDTQGQIKHIKYIEGMASELRKKAKKDYETKGGLCKKGGILLGILAVIMLI